MVCGHHLQNHSRFRGYLFVPSSVHMLSLSFALKEVKWIHNGSFLTRKTDIAVV